jgi:hypothetical protein
MMMNPGVSSSEEKKKEKKNNQDQRKIVQKKIGIHFAAKIISI